MKRNRKRYALAALAAFVVATSSFAFAASNTVPASYAGDGSNTVSGYNVTNVRWDLNDSNPANVDDVTFVLDQSATEVKARVSRGATAGAAVWDTTWASCTPTGTTNEFTCSFSSLATAQLQGLEVASAS